jgi:hypothetical protein
MEVPMASKAVVLDGVAGIPYVVPELDEFP